MTTTLVISEPIFSEIFAAARLEKETAGVLLARAVRTPSGDFRLLARAVRWVGDEFYAERLHDALSITSGGYVEALREAELTETVPIWLHTHPGDGSTARHSTHDREVDRQLSDLFRLRASSAYYGSVIFAHDGDQLVFAGHLESDREVFDIDRLWMVGSRLALMRNERQPERELPDLFDRNVRAFGGGIQRVLGDLAVGIVGCGGTGSSIAEQLTRLGVRRFLLIDPDSISESNLTRVYGSSPKDIGRRKVDVLADHIARIAPEADVERLPGMITVESTARRLTEADIIFGCTDDNAGRLVLSRLSTFMLTPVIDCGVLLTSGDTGILDGIHARVTVLSPGSACLVCRNRLDIARASAELLTPEERVRREDEGYAPALGAIEPAVVAYTTLVAATAVGELLERLVHYGPEPVPNEVLLRVHDREMSTNYQAPRPKHYCHSDSGRLGLGLTKPFLEQTWSA